VSVCPHCSGLHTEDALQLASCSVIDYENADYYWSSEVHFSHMGQDLVFCESLGTLYLAMGVGTDQGSLVVLHSKYQSGLRLYGRGVASLELAPRTQH
jgi:hypothetical protein